MTEVEEVYKSQATGKEAVLATTTNEEDAKLLAMVQNADSLKKVVSIIVEHVTAKYQSRPLDAAAFTSLRVTALQMVNTLGKSGVPKETAQLVADAEKVYKFLIGEEQKTSNILSLNR
jgi:hypothetical protein